MSDVFAWKSQDLIPFVGVMSVTVGYCLYWFLAISPSIKEKFFAKYQGEDAWVNWVLYQKVMGVLFMGVLPGIIAFALLPYSLGDYGLKFQNFKTNLLVTLGIGGFMALVNFKASQKQDNLEAYPQMRIKNWTKKRVFLNSIGWAAYLFAYEFMYRGILLWTCYYSFGFWPAVAINISFYAATHIAKGKTETIGTFPYGLFLCFITIYTGTIWVAYWTHLILALSNATYSIYHNPEMKFV